MTSTLTRSPAPLLSSLPAAQASCILQLVKYIQKLQQKDVEVAEEVNALFAGELNPVAPKAQKKVPVPEGWVNLSLFIGESAFLHSATSDVLMNALNASLK